MIIIKSGGCNHMTCAACKHEFCWLCNKKFTPNHFRPNFMNPCGGRLFTDQNRPSSFVCCQMCRSLLFYILLPIFLVLVFLFIFAVYAYFDEYYTVLRQRELALRRRIHDNRLLQEVRRETLRNVGVGKLGFLGLVSLLISPATFLVLGILLVVFVLIWLGCFFAILYFYCSVMFKVCCSSRVQRSRRHVPVLRAR